MSDQDQSALQLGRLVASSVFNQQEITSSDSVARFFLDNWLARNGSTSKAADTLSLDLMCGLQRALGEHKFDKEDRGALNNEDEDEDGGDCVVDDFSYPTPAAQKLVTAVALEAFDRLIDEFGSTNPILKDIKDALLPTIFVSLVPYIEKGQGEGQGVAVVGDGAPMGKVQNHDSTARKSSAVGYCLPDSAEQKEHSPSGLKECYSDKNADNVRRNSTPALSGRSYIQYLTWRDNVEVVAAELKPTELLLKSKIKENNLLKKQSESLLSENEMMKKLLDDLRIHCADGEREAREAALEQCRLNSLCDKMNADLENSRNQFVKFSEMKEKEKADMLIEKNILISSLNELQEVMESSSKAMQSKLSDSENTVSCRDDRILDLERTILELKSQISILREQNGMADKKKTELLAEIRAELKTLDKANSRPTDPLLLNLIDGDADYSLYELLDQYLPDLRNRVKAISGQLTASEGATAALQTLCDRERKFAEQQAASFQAELKSVQCSADKIRQGLLDQVNSISRSLEDSQKQERAARATLEESYKSIAELDLAAERREADSAMVLQKEHDRYLLLEDQHGMRMSDTWEAESLSEARVELESLRETTKEQLIRVGLMTEQHEAEVAALGKELDDARESTSRFERKILDLESALQLSVEAVAELTSERDREESARTALFVRVDAAEEANEELRRMLQGSDGILIQLRAEMETKCMDYENYLALLIRTAESEMGEFEGNCIFKLLLKLIGIDSGNSRPICVCVY